MPNWCYANYQFYGDKNELKRLYENLLGAIEETPTFEPCENSWKNKWLGNIFLQHGYSKDEVMNVGNISCRGSIEDITWENGGVRLDAESAWSPIDTSIQKLLDEKYHDIKMVFCAEEPNMGLYINTDVEGKYFSDRYVIDGYSESNTIEFDCDRYTSSFENLLYRLNLLTGISKEEFAEQLNHDDFDNVDLSDFVKEKLGIDENDELYFMVFKFSA